MSPPAKKKIWIVDDDMMSREVAALLLADAGFEAAAFECGEDAVAALDRTNELPAAMLLDMQMPGLTGDALAAELREVCGHATRLIAMSGTAMDAARRQQFDTFLMKPFSTEDLQALLGNPAAAVVRREFETDEFETAEFETASLDPGMVSETTFAALRQTMPPAQLRALYKMCLDDVDARLETMRSASEARDPEKFRSAAHSIKGGCGMVGAVELARIAAEFEQHGMPAVHNMVPFQQFLAASARLRGMLGRVLDHAD